MPVLDSPDFDRAFVPIDSLTSSPRSSTESTSVLEWNSNSGSEGFSVDHEQYFHGGSSPTPSIPSPSPNPPEDSFPGCDEVFTSFASAAPVVDTVSDTVTSDKFADEYRELLGAFGERLSLMSSVTQWQNHPGFDRPETPSCISISKTVQDKQPNNIASSPDRSVATSSISAVTATPSLHVSSLFLPPAPSKPQVNSAPPSTVSNHSESKSISIAQYFQNKAAKVEEAEPQPPVDGPPRPVSCLSYASTVASPKAASPVPIPVAVPLPDHGGEALSLHETWQDLIPKVGSRRSGSTRVNPPGSMRSQCSFTSAELSSYQGCDRTYYPRFHSPTFWNSLQSPSSKKPPMENNNTGSQFNPFTSQVIPSPSQSHGTDTLASNSKSQASSKTMPPVIRPQLEVSPTIKPTKLIIPNPTCLTNVPDRQPPYVESPYDSFYGKVHKLTNPPVPMCSLTTSSAYPNYTCSMPDRVSSWYKPRAKDIQASPESTDSWLPPAPALPSNSSVSARWSPAPSESQVSASAVPPSPDQATLRPVYTATGDSNGLSTNAPYVCMLPSIGDTSTQRVPRALPVPSLPKLSGPYTQAPYTPRHTGSTLPRDMHTSAGPPAWGPTPRRLRFAPLPPTPSAGLPFSNSTLPYATPLPPYPLHAMSYPYPPPAPQIPAPASTPYSSWRTGAQNPSPLWAPHPVFWYSDGSIVFIIENVGYKVHRHFFERHSVYFRDFLSLPMYSITTASVPHYIYLTEVKKVDFERLLLIFYPSNLIDPELFTVEEWTSILTLSDKWNFAQLKTLATRELGYITTTIEKIALAKKYNMGNPQWLLAAYRELCTRRHPLSLAEGEKLGLETVIKIWEVQHELTMGTSTWGRPVDIVIQDKFGLL